MNNVRRRPEPVFPPATMQRLSLSAVAACVVGFVITLTLALLSGFQPFWYRAGSLLILAAIGGWNLRTYLQLRSGAHWSQQTDGPEGGA